MTDQRENPEPFHATLNMTNWGCNLCEYVLSRIYLEVFVEDGHIGVRVMVGTYGDGYSNGGGYNKGTTFEVRGMKLEEGREYCLENELTGEG